MLMSGPKTQFGATGIVAFFVWLLASSSSCTPTHTHGHHGHAEPLTQAAPTPPPPLPKAFAEDDDGVPESVKAPPLEPPDPLDPSSWSADEGAKTELASTETRPAADKPPHPRNDGGEMPRLMFGRAPLPLKHTAVTAQLSANVAEVEVKQTYANPHAEPIEVVYVFPLPANSAVNAMELRIGERTIKAKIEERKKARRIYEKAKRRGNTAALLEQERPNVFTQSVANIAPGEAIDVIVRYVQDLTYDAGEYEFVFPTTVGPRFMPGHAIARGARGTGTHPDTNRVPDASRISPAYTKLPSGYVTLNAFVSAGLPVGRVEAPTHPVEVTKIKQGRVRVSLAKQALPNRDFVMRYKVAGQKPRAHLVLSKSRNGKGGFFTLLLHPPKLDIDSLVGKRELIFVIDVSGSMTGAPLALAKATARQGLVGLRPNEKFNIITFAGHTSMAFDRPKRATRANIRRALAHVDGLSAGGGTQLADAVSAALDPQAPERGYHRYVMFLTDGYVGNESQIFERARALVDGVKQRGMRSRVFGIGIGSSVNRHLIEGLSRAGEGTHAYALHREDPLRVTNRIFHYIDRAVVQKVQVDWLGLRPSSVYPQEIPDLFASRPVYLHGRYEGSLGEAGIRISGEAGGQEVAIPVKVLESSPERIQGALWARSKVASLEEILWAGANPQVEREITQLGLAFGLVTRFTSFVAVDREFQLADARPARQVVQPSMIPQGVDGAAAGAVEESLPGMAPPSPEPAEAAPMSGAVDAMEVDSGPRGCGCRLGETSSPRWPLLLAVFALGLARRRRQKGAATRAKG